MTTPLQRPPQPAALQGDTRAYFRRKSEDSMTDGREPGAAFDGRTYREDLDGVRLRGQLAAVYRVLADSWTGAGPLNTTPPARRPARSWWTLDELQAELRVRFGLEATATSLSARVRDLRKDRNGGMVVPTRRRDGGLWEFRLELPQAGQQLGLAL